MRRVDLNADVGEGCGHDAELFDLVTSANVACGWHAGDESTMRTTVRCAIDAGVAVGAHPSYPDRENFGRIDMQRSASDVYDDVCAQVRALSAVVDSLGGRLRHVKPHGALYNRSARDFEIADAIARATRDTDPSLALVGLAGSASILAARDRGLRTIEEGFADRAYLPSGELVPRGTPGAVIEDAGAAVAQVLRLMQRGIETICVHGDAPEAVLFAQRIRRALVETGITVSALD